MNFTSIENTRNVIDLFTPESYGRDVIYGLSHLQPRFSTISKDVIQISLLISSHIFFLVFLQVVSLLVFFTSERQFGRLYCSFYMFGARDYPIKET